MPTKPARSNGYFYRGMVPPEWMETIERYRKQCGMTESEFIRAGMVALMGEGALPAEHLRPAGRQPAAKDAPVASS